MQPSDWIEWREHVLHSLEQHHEDHKEVRGALSDLRIQVAMLKVRAGLWGATAGVIPVLAALLYSLVK